MEAEEPTPSTTWLGMPQLHRRDVLRLAGVAAAGAVVGAAVDACTSSRPRTVMIGQLQQILTSIPPVSVMDALDHEPEVHARSEVQRSPSKYPLPDGRQWPASPLVRSSDMPKLLSAYLNSLGPTVDAIQKLSETLREPVPEDAVTKSDLPGLPVADGEPVLAFARNIASYWAHPLDDAGKPRPFGDQRIDDLPSDELSQAVDDLRSKLQAAMQRLPASPATRPS
ncbi:hypothetical protein [Rugosimonospora africana]|uniref:Uncharacterized protein n=1 Tax=Rugosimonospora africana TaxID=556532 RepID=A0A8J3VUF2_9ACTN|nr:hypothetical protein [Rugosimonospora africana]GIH19210.1 hypothetical protein Raf01_73820 [Rugosimonospora africana]